MNQNQQNTYLSNGSSQLKVIEQSDGTLELLLLSREAPVARIPHADVAFYGENGRLWEVDAITWNRVCHSSEEIVELSGEAADRYGNIWVADMRVEKEGEGFFTSASLRLTHAAQHPWDGSVTGWGSLGMVSLHLPVSLCANPATSWNGIPGLMYGGNKADMILPRGYCPTMTRREMQELRLHERPLRIVTDIPRQDASTGWTVEVLSHNPASPDVLVLDRERETGLHIQVDRECEYGFTGFSYSADPVSDRHLVTLKAPGTRDRRYNICRFILPTPPLEQRGPGGGNVPPAPDNLITINARFHVQKCGDVPTLVRSYRRSWERRRIGQQVENTSPASEIARAALEKINRENWDEGRGFYWFVTAGDLRKGPNKVLQLGWVWGLEVMNPLYRLGDAVVRERVRRMLSFLLDSGAQAGTGLFNGTYDGENWMPARGWFGWLDAMAACACRTPDTVRHGFRLLDALRDDVECPAVLADRWEDALKKAVDALQRVYRREGEIPSFIDPGTEEVVWRGGGGGAMVIDVWCEAARRWNRSDYLEDAASYGEKLHETMILTGDPWGRPVDCYCAGDHETAHALICAYLALWRATGAQVHLDRAVQAADLLLSWQVTENVRYPADSRLARNGIRSLGTMIANTQNSTGVPTPCTNSASELIDLYEATGDVAWIELLADWRRAGLQQMVREGQDWGSLKPGSVTECQSQSDTMSELGDVYLGEAGWVLSAFLQQSVELPSVYVDGEKAWCLDHLEVSMESGVLSVTNPTGFSATATIRVRGGKTCQVQLPPGGTFVK
ncbi:MAG: hypothetical protein NTV93_11275 [Verrucomicrobia bacterium]|nr:hypothetical protein [Verrucomicrobiota bacterium]